jgi:hypothetical protein
MKTYLSYSSPLLKSNKKQSNTISSQSNAHANFDSTVFENILSHLNRLFSSICIYFNLFKCFSELFHSGFSDVQNVIHSHSNSEDEEESENESITSNSVTDSERTGFFFY